jgi:peptidoglycan/LPS O-acetylase OafA/YrhL
VSYLKDIKNKIDMYLGGLSYGIFLNHFFIIEILNKYLIESEIKKTFIAILTSVIFSSVTYHFIEKYSSIFREKIRYNNK